MTSVLQEKQEGGAILYKTNSLSSTISAPTVTTLKMKLSSFYLSTYHTGSLIAGFATCNSI